LNTENRVLSNVIARAALVCASLAAVAFVLLPAPAAAQDRQGGAMAIDCNDATPAIDRECQYGEGEQFTISIHITESPDPDYGAWQAKIRYDAAIVSYSPTPQSDAEKDWPSCTLPARSDNFRQEDVGSESGDPSLLYGCVPFPLAPTNYTGKAAHFAFQCVGGGTSPLDLIAREGDNQLGTHMIDAESFIIDPDLTGASVTCSGQPSQATQPPGNGGQTTPGGPTATGGGPTATGSPQAGVTGTPTDENGASTDDDDDDGGMPVWLWVVIGVVAVAAVGGLGYLGWRRMQGGGGSPSDPTGGTPSGGDAPSTGGGAPPSAGGASTPGGSSTPSGGGDAGSS
jgi:hypothetical protein